MIGPAPPEQPGPEVLTEIARIASLDLELRPMLQRVTDTLRRQFGWEFVACVIIDWEHGRFVCEALSTEMPTSIHVGYSRPIGSGVVGEVASTGKPILLDDVSTHPNFVDTAPGVRSEVCIPVQHAGRIVAVLNAESPRPAAFHGQLPLMERVAAQLAGPIAGARLFDEVVRRARLLEMVSEVSKAALEAGELDLLLARIVDYVHGHFPLSTAAILLVDEEEGVFEQTAQAGGAQVTVPPRKKWSLDRGIVGRAIRTGQMQLVPDVRQDPEYIEVDPGVVAECAVPILLRGRVLGVLNLESHRPDVFTRDTLAVFRTFADQLAGAIHLASVNRELEEANARLRRANRRLSRISSRDALTGIANRRRFDRRLDLEWRRGRRVDAPVSLVMLDIDCFKDYNDLHGHRAGDECLRKVARALRGSMHRAGDLVARYGGEEFAVLIPAMDAEHAARLAERLRATVEELGIPHGASEASPFVTISAGVSSLLPCPSGSPQALIDRADRAMYRAKRAGRNRVCVAGEEDEAGEAGEAVETG